MSLPESRIRTINDGDTFTAGEWNSTQDGIVTNHNRMHTRKVPVSLETGWRVFAGAPSQVIGGSGVVQSAAVNDNIAAPLRGLWGETVSDIVGLRVRINQLGTNQCVASLRQYTDSNVASLVATATSNSSTGWKWLDLGPFTVSIQDGYTWSLELVHDATGGGPTLIEYRMFEIQLGG